MRKCGAQKNKNKIVLHPYKNNKNMKKEQNKIEKYNSKKE